MKQKDMLRNNKSFLFGCVILMAMSSPGVLGQESKVALKDKRITIQMSQKPLYTVFCRLIQKYDVAIRLEESSLDKDHWNYLFETNVGKDFQGVTECDHEIKKRRLDTAN